MGKGSELHLLSATPHLPTPCGLLIGMCGGKVTLKGRKRDHSLCAQGNVGCRAPSSLNKSQESDTCVGIHHCSQERNAPSKNQDPDGGETRLLSQVTGYSHGSAPWAGAEGLSE